MKFRGVFKAVYEVPDDPADTLTQVKVTKRDGKVFFIPVSDMRKINELLSLREDEIRAKTGIRAIEYPDDVR